MAALLLLLSLILSCLSSFGRWKRWSQAVVERVLWSVLRLVRAYFFDNRIERAGPVNLLKSPTHRQCGSTRSLSNQISVQPAYARLAGKSLIEGQDFIGAGGKGYFRD